VLRRQQAILEQQLAEIREARAQSKPVDVQVLDLIPAGGGGTYVDFILKLVNYGTRQCRCKVTARVGGEAVDCQPAVLDLVANDPPQPLRVLVPKPELGDLMAECNNETTLYGEELVVQIVDGDGPPVESVWRELIYDSETHRERYEVQQRYWRMGRGQETEADRRAAYLAERIRRNENDEPETPNYDWS
jgi:hypothetical protein